MGGKRKDSFQSEYPTLVFDNYCLFLFLHSVDRRIIDTSSFYRRFIFMYPERYKIESSKRTPRIMLDMGRIFIMGRSIPDDPGDLYGPILNWISEYIRDFKGKTTVDLGFEYINTTSTKWIFLMLKELSEMKDLSLNTSISWYYENGDEDMGELGHILRSLVDCPLKVVEVNQMNLSFYDRILSEKA